MMMMMMMSLTVISDKIVSCRSSVSNLAGEVYDSPPDSQQVYPLLTYLLFSISTELSQNRSRH